MTFSIIGRFTVCALTLPLPPASHHNLCWPSPLPHGTAIANWSQNIANQNGPPGDQCQVRPNSMLSYSSLCPSSALPHYRREDALGKAKAISSISLLFLLLLPYPLYSLPLHTQLCPHFTLTPSLSLNLCWPSPTPTWERLPTKNQDIAFCIPSLFYSPPCPKPACSIPAYTPPPTHTRRL